MQKDLRLTECNYFFINPWLSSLVTFLFLRILGMVSRIIYSIPFTGIEGTATGRTEVDSFLILRNPKWGTGLMADCGLHLCTPHNRLIQCSPLCLSPGSDVGLRLNLLWFFTGCSSHPITCYQGTDQAFLIKCQVGKNLNNTFWSREVVCSLMPTNFF